MEYPWNDEYLYFRGHCDRDFGDFCHAFLIFKNQVKNIFTSWAN